jgi:hypothetical protein
MIDTHALRLVKPAGRAHPGISIQCHGFRLDSSDENEQGFILLS